MSKFKLIWNISPVLLIATAGFLAYLLYNSWQSEKLKDSQIKQLNQEISQIKEKQLKDNETLAQNERDKLALENKSIEQQDKINELLKSNQCANELVPDDVSNLLYNRASQIRKSTNTGQSIK